MKAYVIKNKEGEYYFDETENDFVYPINNKCIYNSVCEIERRFLPSQALLEKGTIVPITICEGDIEEENRVLKKALELACEELKARDENKTHAKLVIQQIRNEWLGENVDYKDWFIQQAKESD